MTEVAILGGGCFWCTESVFAGLKGVMSVVPGYTGGQVAQPTYEQVCSQNTGHIEVVRVEFDPDVLSYQTLLEVFFATHDPTTPDRQGADIGPQYASAIFFMSDEQRQTAEAVIQQLEADTGLRVVTKVREAQTFWEAERYHHDYYARNSGQGYCQVVIAPKLQKLRRQYAKLLA